MKYIVSQIRIKKSKHPQACKKCPFWQNSKLTCSGDGENAQLFIHIQDAVGGKSPFCMNHTIGVYENTN